MKDPQSAADGVRYLPGTRLTEVVREAAERRIRFDREGGPDEVVADEVLLAVGRAPNVEDLGLEAAGVAFDGAGVEVDDALRSTNRRIFAAGDIVRSYKFTHLADFHARIVVQNALFPFLPRARASKLVVPWCTYTSPEIAHVGLYERDARERGIAIDTLTLPLADVDRAVLDGEDEGFLRLHLARGKDRILGATLVAEHAGETIGELCLAITHGIGLARIQRTIHPYPTQAEVIRRAGDAWRRGKLTPTARRAFGAWFRLFR